MPPICWSNIYILTINLFGQFFHLHSLSFHTCSVIIVFILIYLENENWFRKSRDSCLDVFSIFYNNFCNRLRICRTAPTALVTLYIDIISCTNNFGITILDILIESIFGWLDYIAYFIVLETLLGIMSIMSICPFPKLEVTTEFCWRSKVAMAIYGHLNYWWYIWQ